MPSKNNYNELFFEELQVLDKAKNTIFNKKYHSNELLPEFQELLKSYEKLLKLTKKTFVISDTQSLSIKKRECELQNLLDHANQGFLTFGKNLLIHRRHSAECYRIFREKISGIPITELIWKDHANKEGYLSLLYTIFSTDDEDLQVDALRQLPTVVELHGRFIHVEFKLISQVEDHDYSEDMIMLILTDITESKRSNDRVEYLSYHDSLTSLYNRNYIEKIIPSLLDPSKQPLSLIYMDMNGLKISNDVFGHTTGDQLLSTMANIIKQSCREDDIISRWGGDEFVVLLPKTTKEECDLIVDRLKSLCSSTKSDNICLSVSVGVATLLEDTNSLHELFEIAEKRMYQQKLHDSKTYRVQIIENIMEIMEEHHFLDQGHIDRVFLIAKEFCGSIGLDEKMLEDQLKKIAKWHDIGMVSIPEEIVRKTGSLTPNEWNLVKSHSEIGYRMASSIGEGSVGEVILSIHERWDGTGYPYQLKGENIPLLSRIFAIVDAFDIMTHTQVYKDAISVEEALRELEKEVGRQFDPILVQSFIQYQTSVHLTKKQ